jgi:hypothetical protein
VSVLHGVLRGGAGGKKRPVWGLGGNALEKILLTQ